MRKLVTIQINRDDIKRLRAGEVIELREGELLSYEHARIRQAHVETNGKAEMPVERRKYRTRAIACPDCGKRLRSKNGLGPHRRNCPGRGGVRSKPSTGIPHKFDANGRLKCPVCPRTFNKTQGLNAHVGQAHRGWQA